MHFYVSVKACELNFLHHFLCSLIWNDGETSLSVSNKTKQWFVSVRHTKGPKPFVAKRPYPERKLWGVTVSILNRANRAFNFNHQNQKQVRWFPQYFFFFFLLFCPGKKKEETFKDNTTCILSRHLPCVPEDMTSTSGNLFRDPLFGLFRKRIYSGHIWEIELCLKLNFYLLSFIVEFFVELWVLYFLVNIIWPCPSITCKTHQDKVKLLLWKIPFSF